MTIVGGNLVTRLARPEAVQQSGECADAFVSRVLLIGCVRDEHRSFLRRGEKNMSKNRHRLIGRQTRSVQARERSLLCSRCTRLF